MEKASVPVVESVAVTMGANTTVVMKSSAQAAGPAAVAPLSPTSPPVVPRTAAIVTGPSGAASQGWWLGRTWTWVAGGSAVLLTGAAAGVGLSVNSRYDELNDSCGSGSTARPGCDENDISSLRTRRNVANVLWGLAGAAAVTTGVLFLVEGRTVTVVPVAGETTGFLARVGFE
jgi:hypothetical protein